MHPFQYSPHPTIHSFIYLSIHSLIYSFIHPSIHAANHSFIHPLHPSIHSSMLYRFQELVGDAPAFDEVDELQVGRQPISTN